eukprot:316393_1
MISNTKPFYSNVNDFINDKNKSFRITIENSDSEFYQQIKNLNAKYNGLLSGYSGQFCICKFNLTVTPLTTYSIIQNKISSAFFDNAIPANNIQMYNNGIPLLVDNVIGQRHLYSHT